MPRKSIFLLIFFSFFQHLIAFSSNEAFDQGINQATYYETSLGKKLRYANFLAPSGKSQKNIVFVEGRGTFLEFYRDFIINFLERDFNIWIYDLSGQGGSQRLIEGKNHDEKTIQCMQHIDDFSYYVNDLDEFIKNIVLPHFQGRLILSGYSTGAHVALRYLQSNATSPFSAAFFFSPLLYLKSQVPNYILKNILLISLLLYDKESYQGVTKNEDLIFSMNYEGNPYTNSRKGFYEIRDLCRDYRSFMMGGVSRGWALAASNSIDQLWKQKNIQSISIPVLIATGGEDGVVRIDYNAEFALKIPLGHHILYPKGKHELFREKKEIRNKLWKDFDDFMIKFKLTSIKLDGDKFYCA